MPEKTMTTTYTATLLPRADRTYLNWTETPIDASATHASYLDEGVDNAIDGTDYISENQNAKNEQQYMYDDDNKSPSNVGAVTSICVRFRFRVRASGAGEPAALGVFLRRTNTETGLDDAVIGKMLETTVDGTWKTGYWTFDVTNHPLNWTDWTKAQIDKLEVRFRTQIPSGGGGSYDPVPIIL